MPQISVWEESTQMQRQNKKIERNLFQEPLCPCGRWDLNPHDCNNHQILSLACLPIPALPHILCCSVVSCLTTRCIIAPYIPFVNNFFEKN